MGIKTRKKDSKVSWKSTVCDADEDEKNEKELRERNDLIEK